MSKITITDVAKKANTSKSTVSQYLSNRFEYMSTDTKNKIAAAIEELGFRPNALAQSLKKKKTKTIGIILPNVLYSFSSQVFRAIEDFFYSCGYQVICCNSDDDELKERNYIEMLLDKQIDGLIALPTGKNKKTYKDLEAKNFPVVLVGRKIKGSALSLIVLDNVNAAYAATKHFIDTGHRRIAIITFPIDSQSPRAERIDGYKDALSEQGIPIDDSYIHSIPVAEIQPKLDEMLKSEMPPTAILLGNDFILREMLDYARKNDIQIPHQLAVIAFDQSPYLDFYKPSISTMTLPAYEMGKEAAKVLLSKITKTEDAANAPKVIVFDATLVIRES